MDNYKDLLINIFDRTVKDSILVSKEEVNEDGLRLSNFTIKFQHADEKDDKTYEMIKELFKRIENDLRGVCQKQ